MASSFSIHRDEQLHALTVSNSLGLPSVKDVSTMPVGATGQIVLDSTTGALFYSNGSAWKRIESSDLYTDHPIDFVVVGGGTAGNPCARALSNVQTGGVYTYSVMVLERGKNLNDDPLVVDPTIASGNDLTWDPKYAETHITLSQDTYSEGRLIGGGSAHNGMQCVRGTPDVYNQWAAISGEASWSYANLLPIMLSQERYTPDGTVADLTQRGTPTSGYMCCTQEAPLTDAFTASVATGFGVPLIADYNDHFQIAGVYQNLVGVSANQDYITAPPGSERSHSGNGYLFGISTPSVTIPAVVDANGNGLAGRKLYVRTSVTATRIIMAGTKAVGVEVVVNNGVSDTTQLVFANRGVILSLGAFNTPAILNHSGIGRAADLTAQGISVVVDSPNVGYNMQNQYGPSALVRRVTGGPPPPAFKLTPAFTDLGLAPLGERKYQTIMIYPGSLIFTPSLISALNLGSYDSVFMSGLYLRAQSRGTVKIRSNDPLTPPLIDLGNYNDGLYSTPGTDAYNAVQYLKQLQAVVAAGGGGAGDVLFPPNSHYPAPWGPAPDDSLLFDSAKTAPFNSYHCVGSCRMGTNISNGVVNGQLAVFGTSNLYIADASVMPAVTTGNTAYPCYIIGLKLAQFLGGVI